jgi:hypothetical protein
MDVIMEYLKLFEKFEEETIPGKFHTTLKEIEKDFLSGDYEKVSKHLDELRENSEHIPQEDIYFPTVFPSVELEEKVNTGGISKTWKIPFGFDEEHLENLIGIFMIDENITDIVFREVLKMNPDLLMFENIPHKVGDLYTKHAVIGGICSRFNENDIRDFIESKRTIKHIDNDKNYIFTDIDGFYGSLFNSVRRKVGNIDYFPSTGTLSKLMYSK